MPRLFVAVPVPPAVADRLLEIRISMPGVRWLSADSLHVTLCFLGQVHAFRLPAIDEALCEIRHPPVAVRCLGTDVYGGAEGPPRAMVRTVETPAPLTGLHRAVEQVLRPIVPMRHRRFRPHVTVARIRRSVRPRTLHHCLEGPGAAAPVTWMAEEFSLYSSHLGREAAVYETEASYLLGSGWHGPRP